MTASRASGKCGSVDSFKTTGHVVTIKDTLPWREVHIFDSKSEELCQPAPCEA